MYNQSENFQIYDKIASNPYVLYELFEYFLGNCIGEGSSRWVFDFNDKLVLKVEKKDWNANVIEYDTWLAVQGTKWQKWFAPIEYISPNGRFLLQRKCEKLYEQPKKLPEFFSDVRLNNLGILDGQIVAVDYSINTVLEKGFKNSKLIPIKEYIK